MSQQARNDPEGYARKEAEWKPATRQTPQTRLTASESEVAGLRESGDWLFTALNLAQAENTMCLDHFREAEMTTWVQGLMTVRAKSQAALDQWTATKAALRPAHTQTKSTP